MIAFWTVKDDKDDNKRGYFMIHDVLIPLTFVRESGKMIYRQPEFLSMELPNGRFEDDFAVFQPGILRKSVFGTQQWSFVKLGFSKLLMDKAPAGVDTKMWTLLGSQGAN